MLAQFVYISSGHHIMGKDRAYFLFRIFLAEFLGTLLLVLLGDGSVAEASQQGEPFIHISFGFGFALMVSILVSGGVSGAHLNPAVTLSMAALGKCSWVAVPVYMVAQYLGAFSGAAMVFGIYADLIRNSPLYTTDVSPSDEKGRNLASAGIFATYPIRQGIDPDGIPTYPSTVTLVMDQLLGTACLMVIVLAVTDEKNMKVPPGLYPLLIGLGLTGIHISLGANAGCAINPARDLGPRLLTLVANFGRETFTAFDYFFWIPWLMPHVGALIGALCYYGFIAMHYGLEDASAN